MSDSAKVTLNIKLEDPGGAYQINVFDNDFRCIASATGNLSVDLLPGIYKVQASVTRKTWEQLVLLQPGSGPVVVEVPILAIDSPAPLKNTAQSHEYHQGSAYEESRQVHFTAGSGSAIFVFARRYGQTETGKASPPVHPLLGAALHDASGALVVDLQARSAASLAPGDDPWAACNVVVDAGYYRLRLTLPSGDQVDQPLYAVRGWQLQLFALQAAFGPKPEDLRANLVESSLFYRSFNADNPGASEGFAASDESYRLTELARQGLLEKRAVLQEEVRSMLWLKSGNPMLGLMGGHLLLMDATPDLDKLNTVVQHLRSILGDHPDVEALALALDEPNRSYFFRTLPMLRKSWKQVLKASIKRPEIVPIDSEASALSNHLWGEGVWMFSTVKPPEAAVNASSVVQSLMKQPLQQQLTAFESAAVEQLAGSGSRDLESYVGTPSEQASSKGPQPQLDDATAEMMVDTLGVPRGTVELFLQRANEKANLYESARTQLQPGFQRTRAMNKILSEIRTTALSDKQEAAKSLTQLINENSDGSRIAAIGILQIEPDPEHLPFTLDAINHSRSAFEQYQALSAAKQLVPHLSSEQKSQLKEAIESQRGDRPDQYIKPGTDRYVLSEQILPKL